MTTSQPTRRNHTPSSSATSVAVQDRFRRAVERHGGVMVVARVLGCSRATVDNLIAGRRRPGLQLAFSIQDILHIYARAWVLS